MNIEQILNLILCVMIIAVYSIFIIVNVNYMPNKDENLDQQDMEQDNISD